MECAQQILLLSRLMTNTKSLSKLSTMKRKIINQLKGSTPTHGVTAMNSNSVILSLIIKEGILSASLSQLMDRENKILSAPLLSILLTNAMMHIPQLKILSYLIISLWRYLKRATFIPGALESMVILVQEMKLQEFSQSKQFSISKMNLSE